MHRYTKTIQANGDTLHVEETGKQSEPAKKDTRNNPTRSSD